MITYREVGSSSGAVPSWRIQVLIGGRRVGDIHKVVRGYRYFPKGCNVGGDVLPTVAAVKKYLEDGGILS